MNYGWRQISNQHFVTIVCYRLEIEKKNYCESSGRFILLSPFTGRILFLFVLYLFTENTSSKRVHKVGREAESDNGLKIDLYCIKADFHIVKRFTILHDILSRGHSVVKRNIHHRGQNCVMEKCNDYFLAELKMRC
ncbi:hypothetical protein T12_2146 [Trichinella patagoniensis]|uniref:Uncharacterized protein n=1 Tax=Trichinella patagoniensis TaxID=990121 RepID=A0A0V1ACC9_9BILA|nr:hypothetical protein T12_2146 [Trichinella patagoniensis]